MSRYRAPSGPSTALITEQGFETLLQEQKDLWLKRREVTAALSAAAAEGDRSENAEYIYRKKELAGIDRRVRYLQKRLPSLRVVKERPADTSKAFFGAFVELSDEDGETLEVRIVGPDEIDPAQQWISVDSLMARALLKNTVGDEITVSAPKGQSIYYIESITYR
ncbi:transcription elongation factor GreB [Chromatiales bacterium (ex Bugula neritina AB1)]|nr:transcription elongation factor GreB [Chromatiales bacterium (ex Bugula neritina AB1)]